MRLLDEQYTRTPFYGVRRMTAWLRAQGYVVNHKRVARLLHTMGLETLYAKPRTSQAQPGHRVYPYLLRGVPMTRVNQVWSTDITSIRLHAGFIYLVAVMDWFSRDVLSWAVSIHHGCGDFVSTPWSTREGSRNPRCFNSDQGVQFTSTAFTSRLEGAGIQISMDGRGRALDNVFVERLWRTVKYEEVYLTRVRDATGGGDGVSAVLRILQWAASPSGAGLPDTGSGVFRCRLHSALS